MAFSSNQKKKKTSIDDLSKEEQEILLKKIKSLAGIRVRLSNQSTQKKRNLRKNLFWILLALFALLAVAMLFLDAGQGTTAGESDAFFRTLL